MYSLKDYHYDLPERLIAHRPLNQRDSSKLLLLNRNTDDVSHHRFNALEKLLLPNDVLVINNTKVIPGRLFGKKETGGKAVVLILNYAQGINREENSKGYIFKCLINSSKKPKIGSQIFFSHGLRAIVKKHMDGIYQLEFTGCSDFEKRLYQIGKVPLPPYIKRNTRHKLHDDSVSYQTVYASEKGAIAAPTAGLHFTPDLIQKIKLKGIKIVSITLHVGYGTFLPVRTQDIRKHKMHSEWYSISKKSANSINLAKKHGARVISVGTTCVRTLEHAFNKHGKILQGSGQCDLFVFPGYKFNVIDAMITNFHLPESTLLMLVSAFAGRERVLQAYKKAILNNYRFFSYGDSMLII